MRLLSLAVVRETSCVAFDARREGEKQQNVPSGAQHVVGVTQCVRGHLHRVGGSDSRVRPSVRQVRSRQAAPAFSRVMRVRRCVKGWSLTLTLFLRECIACVAAPWTWREGCGVVSLLTRSVQMLTRGVRCGSTRRARVGARRGVAKGVACRTRLAAWQL